MKKSVPARPVPVTLARTNEPTFDENANNKYGNQNHSQAPMLTGPSRRLIVATSTSLHAPIWTGPLRHSIVAKRRGSSVDKWWVWCSAGTGSPTITTEKAYSSDTTTTGNARRARVTTTANVSVQAANEHAANAKSRSTNAASANTDTATFAVTATMESHSSNAAASIATNASGHSPATNLT